MKRLVVISGAGLSAESGIPTFRATNGMWENFDINVVCNYKTWLPNYIAVNDFYNARRVKLKDVEPNVAHLAISKLASKYTTFNITTNVDDLLERAGCVDVFHLHGELTSVITKYGTPEAKLVHVGYEKSPYEDLSLYPVKPNVVFFGEGAPLYQFMYDFFDDLTSNDLVLIIGSSDQVIPFVDMLAATKADRKNVWVVNNDKTVCSRASMYGLQSYCMTAVEFFQWYSADIESFMDDQPTITDVDA